MVEPWSEWLRWQVYLMRRKCRQWKHRLPTRDQLKVRMTCRLGFHSFPIGWSVCRRCNVPRIHGVND